MSGDTFATVNIKRIKEKGGFKMNKRMTKQEFMAKHELTAMDYRNLIRYEEAIRSGAMNMIEYLYLMERHGINGGAKLAVWIQSGTNYEEFLSTLGKEVMK